MRLEILVGMIASGKSTYARKRADEGALVISHDDLTEMLHARYRYEQGLRDLYRRIEELLAWDLLSYGKVAIVDRTHLTFESRHRWIKWVADFISVNTFEDKGPSVEIVAVRFPIFDPMVHARRRCIHDPRGRSQEEWIEVAEHHAEQARKEPLNLNEGFGEIIEATCEHGISLFEFCELCNREHERMANRN